MDRGYDPVKVDGSDKLLYPLAVTLSGFRKWDKPSKKKLPVEVDLVELLCSWGFTGFAGEKDSVIGDWCLIAFYYLLRVGEYTTKGTSNESKQTVQFRVMDVTLFELNEHGQIRRIPKGASPERILAATGATLRLSNQKNGWKGVCIHHSANGDPVLCPVKALARRYLHIISNTDKVDCELSAFFVDGIRHDLTDKMVRDSLKLAARRLNYEDRGIFEDQVDTHSLRAGGANALHLNGYSGREIQKMGRWRSDTFKEYITEGLNKFSEGMSKSMKKLFNYVNVQGRAEDLVQADADLVDVVDITREMVGLPYEVAAH